MLILIAADAGDLNPDQRANLDQFLKRGGGLVVIHDGVCGHDPKLIVLDPDVWTKIVWAAKDSEDWRLRTLIEQAVMGPKR